MIKWTNLWKAEGLTQQAPHSVLAIIIYCCGSPDLHYKWMEEATLYLNHTRHKRIVFAWDNSWVFLWVFFLCVFLQWKLQPFISQPVPIDTGKVSIHVCRRTHSKLLWSVCWNWERKNCVIKPPLWATRYIKQEFFTSVYMNIFLDSSYFSSAFQRLSATQKKLKIT